MADALLTYLACVNKYLGTFKSRQGTDQRFNFLLIFNLANSESVIPQPWVIERMGKTTFGYDMVWIFFPAAL